MNINSNSECFITIKDHKPNFENTMPTRLINPAKNETGKISKFIVENINNRIRINLNLQQWKNTGDVIKWFKQIKNKNSYKFMVFDIKDFHPSITETLLKKAIFFAQQHTNINKSDLEIIYHSRKSLLFKNNEPWIKKKSENFDVTMGAYDGAEICELVGLFLLSTLSASYPKENIGLYRDDGLAIFKDINGRTADIIRKQFHALFKRNKLELEIECNLKIINYLDVTLLEKRDI